MEGSKIVRLLTIVNTYGVGFIVYFGIGFASALVEWGVFAAALTVTPPIMAACAGFVVATFFNFLLARRFAFVSRLGWFHELALVFLASGAVFAWNLAVFYILYRFFLVPLIVAKMMGTLVGFLLNYGARQFWISSRRPRFPSASTMLRATAQKQNQDPAIAADD